MESMDFEEKMAELMSSMGFNKNEGVVYIDLVKHNNSTALEISKRTKRHRTNIYDSLRRLLERGFISEVVDENKRVFQAMGPEKIKNYLKQRDQELEFALSELQKFSETESDEGTFNVRHGVFAARETMREMLKLNEPIYAYGASKEAVEGFGESFLKEFHKERIEKKIMMSHVYDKDSIDRIKYLNKMKYTEAKFIPEKYHTVASTAVCGDIVAIFIFTKPVCVIKINNKIMADAYRKYFEILYRQGRK